MKTPEQYFEEQEFEFESKDAEKLSPEEQLFVDRYLGGKSDSIRTVKAEGSEQMSGAGFQEAAVPHAAEQLETSSGTKFSRTAVTDRDRLKSQDEVQLVSFFMGSQEYALPIETVKEVIKYIQPTRIPAAPDYLEGVINLRHRVTPIVRLSGLLSPGSAEQGKNRFIVVCSQDRLQVGLLVERIATMYRMPSDDIEWNVESALAMGSSFVSALIKNREKIISILSIEAIVTHLLEK